MMNNLAESSVPKSKVGKTAYTIEEIAELLGISRKSAYSLVKSGEFHYVRVGRSIRVSKKVFDQWLGQ